MSLLNYLLAKRYTDSIEDALDARIDVLENSYGVDMRVFGIEFDTNTTSPTCTRNR